MDQVREVLRYHRYGYKTEQAYTRWILRFIKYNGTRHPREMGKSEIEAFLSHLAIDRNVADSTQSQALNAIVFLYKHVLDLPVSEELSPIRSKKPVRLPVVLSQHSLIARLMYGGGLGLMEVIRLRIQDIDFANRFLAIRASKDGKDRATLLPRKTGVKSFYTTIISHPLFYPRLLRKHIRQGIVSRRLFFANGKQLKKDARKQKKCKFKILDIIKS